MAVHFHSTAFTPHTTFFDRKAVEDQIEALIALLDAADGDCDLEDEPAEQDAGDMAEELELYATPPLYGSDQSLGPINELEACRDYQAALYRRAA